MEQAKADMRARTGQAMSDHAQSMAAGMIQRKIRDTLKPYLPRFLHPLLPGVRGSVKERVAKDVKRSISRWIGGCVFTILFMTVFFGLAGGILIFAGVTIWMSI